jgi:hypothetical protein
VRTGLPQRLIAETPQRSGQVGTVAVAGNFHAARTSSRTKCRRMTLGRSDSFSK